MARTIPTASRNNQEAQVLLNALVGYGIERTERLPSVIGCASRVKNHAAAEPFGSAKWITTLKNQRKRSALDPRSVIVAVLVLLIGAGLGFGVGYKYAKRGTTAKAKTTAAATPGKAQTSHVGPSAQTQAQSHAKLVECLAAKGIKYSAPNANVSVPPPGVDRATWNKAVGECYASLAKAG